MEREREKESEGSYQFLPLVLPNPDHRPCDARVFISTELVLG